MLSCRRHTPVDRYAGLPFRVTLLIVSPTGESSETRFTSPSTVQHHGTQRSRAEARAQPATEYRLVIATRLKAFITVASQVTAEIWSGVSAAAAVW
jgi:hypothetical protein